MPGMSKNRMEAFSDAVMAVAITIMVLELKAPHGVELSTLIPLLPKFFSYLLSFIYIGIYWNNHHHMLHTVHHVNGSILWANNHLLFWITLIPFSTAWMGENNFAMWAVILYGAVLFMCAIAYVTLQFTIIKSQGAESLLKKAVKGDWKGKVSPVMYFTATLCAFWSIWLSMIIYFSVALMWLIPDKRIEKYYVG